MYYRNVKIININRILIFFLFAMTTPSFGAILENGWSVVACKPESSAGGSTLAIKDITKFGTIWNTPMNRGNTIDHSKSMPTGAEWFPSDFGGDPVFSTTIDPRDGSIYTVTTSLYNIGSTAVTPATIYKIDNVTGSVPTVLATLPGNAGGSFLDIDINHDQLFVIDMDSGTIHRVSLSGTLLSSYDPLNMDDGLSRYPALGERLLGVAYNAKENRVYYSVWADDAINNGNPNVVRSIGLNASGDFNTASDDMLEISLTTNQPVADIEFNSDYTSVLLAETGFDSSIPRTQPHQAAVTEWAGGTKTWSQVGTNGYYRIGQGSLARNARGGAAWAYSTANAGGGITGLDDFILVTADLLRVSSPAIYGYQFIPRNNPPRDLANSIVADLDNNVDGQDKSVYGDVDIYIEPAPVGNVDIAIDKQMLRMRAPPAPGKPVEYQVTVTNLGPNTATNIVVNDLLPAGLANVSVGITGPTLGPVPIYNANTGELRILSLTAQDAVTLSVSTVLDHLACGEIVNTASLGKVDQIDSDDSNNQATVAFQLSPCVSCVDPANTRIATTVGTSELPICHTCPDPFNSNKTVAPTTVVLTAGKDDGFVQSDGLEPVSRSPQLNTFFFNTHSFRTRHFDDTFVHLYFAHTIPNLPKNIVTGNLEMELRTRKPYNDDISLQLLGGSQFAWTHKINTLPAAWILNNSIQDVLINLNLKDLPPNSPFNTDIISDINANQRLDVYINGDAAVDDMTLTLQTCPLATTKIPDELSTLRRGKMGTDTNGTYLSPNAFKHGALR